MTIIGETTEDGTLIEKLTFGSHKKVLQKCDNCGREALTVFREIVKQRSRHKNELDYCNPCSSAMYNTGRRKSPEEIEKLSKAHQFKSKLYKDREIKNRMRGEYLHSYNEKTKKFEPEHRKIIKDYGFELSKEQRVHHINGDKLDNRIENLFICENQKEHAILHGDLELFTLSLVKKGIILFNKEEKKYYLNPLMEMISFPLSLGFEDITFSQKKNIVKSRLDVDIKSEIIRGVIVNIPLIASNMSTVINSEFYIKLQKLGAFGILHRALNDDLYEKEIKKVSKECEYVAVSVGVSEKDALLCDKLITYGANIITIDIAHGYSDEIINFASNLKIKYPHIKIIIGNVVNEKIMYEIFKFADAIKVGIAQGFACETKNTAGATEKQFSAVFKFKQLSKKFGIPIISDGSTKEPADFVKAIGAGANSVMAGKIFAMCPESAAPEIEIDGTTKKLYAGMASRYVQNQWKGGLKSGTCPEGTVRYLDLGESVDKLLERYSGALRSGITYAGAKDIKSFQDNIEFIRLA